MYCRNCGAELPDGIDVCESCGMPVGATGVGMPASGLASGSGARHDSYEYVRTTVKSDLATVATDCYQSLGFELTGSKASTTGESTALAFRRSRKVRGKAQLAKLQRTADDLLAQLARLEGAKTRRARALALTMGIASALVLGVGMCCCMVWTQLMALGIVVGIVGIAGCVATWLLFRAVVRKDTDRIEPQIAATYDQLATVCEEAQTVLAVA